METHVLSNILGRNAVHDMKKVDTLYNHVLEDYVTGVGKIKDNLMFLDY